LSKPSFEVEMLKPTDSDDYIHVVMPMFVQW